jgi:tartrate-resistant acid phosphatase type 5
MADKQTIRFIVFGDVGAGQDGAFGHEQLRVSQAMSAICPPRSLDPKNGCDFALITGDLIYPDGVSDVWDRQFVDKFEQMYRSYGDKFKFFAVTGNHDHRGNVTAQVEYTYLSKLWYMPERHYAVPNLPSWLRIYGLDTNPISNGESEKAQLAAAKEYLCKKDGWHIIFGHHPAVSHGSHGHSHEMARWYDKLDRDCSINVVFSGHDHNQQHIVTNFYDQIVQGAGGYETHKVNENAEDGSIDLEEDRKLKHTQKFAKERHGFAMVEATQQSLTINFYDIHRWEYGVLSYKEKPKASDYLYRCKKIPGSNCEAF